MKMKVKKINQSYAYCERQEEWIKSRFHKDIRIKDMDRDKMESDFFSEFGIRRSFRALKAKANRLGVRGSKQKLVAGKSIKRAKEGECPVICISTNPVRYISLARYAWQKHHDVELSDSDVVIHIDGDTNNCDISNLDVLSRTELLLANKLPSSVGMETRALIAKIESRVANLKGRGEWSSKEAEWVLSQKVPKVDKKGFWVEKAEEFNKIFNKDRTNRCLMMVLYRK